jgi:hypothetical protein
MKNSKSNGHEAFCPADGEKVSILASGGIAKISLPSGIRTINVPRQIRELGCVLRSTRGNIFEVTSTDSQLSMLLSNKSYRTFALTPTLEVSDRVMEKNENCNENEGKNVAIKSYVMEPLFLGSLSRKFHSQTKQLGRLSFREVSLNSIKSQISQTSAVSSVSSVVYRLGAGGGTVICANQVALRKTNENDFVLEGGPGSIFSEARNVVYSKFFYL